MLWLPTHKNLKGNRLIVLSDLHLWGPEDPLYRGLILFLKDHLTSGDRLFLLGDVFDLLISSKRIFQNRYKDLFQALASLGERSVEIYYFEGNHDFHLSGLFEKCPHITVLKGDLEFEWNKKRFYFSHGDRINLKDLGYQTFRFHLYDCDQGRSQEGDGRKKTNPWQYPGSFGRIEKNHQAESPQISRVLPGFRPSQEGPGQEEQI